MVPLEDPLLNQVGIEPWGPASGLEFIMLQNVERAVNSIKGQNGSLRDILKLIVECF